MEEVKLKITKFDETEIILTSGGLLEGMSENSYQLSIGDCGWDLLGTEAWGIVDYDFTYYDENGNTQTTSLLSKEGWGYARNCGAVDRWFHYNSTNGTYQICSDSAHHISQ